jgi:hypothetical protein
VTVRGLSEGASRRTAERCKGRQVLAIQDTSSVRLGGRKVRARGYGPVGKGGATGGVILHPVLAVDADSGELIGLADVAVWNRTKRPQRARAQRSLNEKESHRWLTGIERAADVLADSAEVTVVSDRESDIYEDFACRPDGVHLLVRSGFNRRINDDQKLFEYTDSLPVMGEIGVTIPAAPGRSQRHATLALRYSKVRICRPKTGMPADDLKALPEEVALYVIDIRETRKPEIGEPVHWRLLTSHRVTSLRAACRMLEYYRKRWIIEDFFRTMKSSGFHIEETDIADPEVMVKFTALAAIAAVTVTQMLRARDNPNGQSLEDAFDADDAPIIEAICKKYEGKNPTARQKNPHPPGTLAYVTWVIGRLGGWTGYYGKPGATVLSRGLQKYRDIKFGASIANKDV